MGKPVEQRRRHLSVAEHARPFAEGEIGRDDDASLFVKATEHVEQQGATREFQYA